MIDAYISNSFAYTVRRFRCFRTLTRQLPRALTLYAGPQGSITAKQCLIGIEVCVSSIQLNYTLAVATTVSFLIRWLCVVHTSTHFHFYMITHKITCRNSSIHIAGGNTLLYFFTNNYIILCVPYMHVNSV